jgi:hypothetical protein
MAWIAYQFPHPGFIMSNYTHQTAPTQFVEAAGFRFAYRRFGKKQNVPLLFFMHFKGTMVLVPIAVRSVASWYQHGLPNPHVPDIRQEILHGKSEWSVAERTREACDLFEVQAVEPLRELRDEGRIGIDEKSAPAPGQHRVVYVFVRAILKV